MKKNKIGTITSMASAIIVCLLTLIKESAGLKNPGFTWVFWAIVGITLFALLSYSGYLVYNAIMTHRRNKNMVDTSSILERSRRVTKDIKHVITTVEKTIKKFVEEHDTLDEDRKKQRDAAKANILSIAHFSDARKEQAAREISYFENLDPKNVSNEVTKDDKSQEQILKLNKTVLTSISEINRALLVLEQYDTRIYLGDYVLGHSSNVLECADALIDYKGWTYALIGKLDKFNESVNEGIILLKDYLTKNEKLDYDMESKIHLKLARAHRHLGSEVISAKKDSKNAIEENNKALAELNVFEDLTVESIEKQFKEDKKEDVRDNKLKLLAKVEEMRVGIYYGILNAQLFEINERRSKDVDVNLAKDLLVYIKQTRELIEKSKGFSNPHRYLKCILLENEFLKILEPTLSTNVQEVCKEELKELFGEQEDIKKYICKRFDNNTEVADKAFDNAIYADEMMEIYINQEATQLFRIIKEIGR